MKDDDVSWVLIPHMNGMKRFETQDTTKICDSVNVELPAGEIDGLVVRQPGNKIEEGRVSRIEFITQQLNHAFASYGAFLNGKTIQPSELRDKYSEIFKACQTLERALHLDTSVDLDNCNAWEPLLYPIYTGLYRESMRCGRSEQNTITEILKNVARLKTLAQMAEGTAAVKVSKSKSQHTGRPELKHLFGNLHGIWIDAYENLPEHYVRHPYRTFCNAILAYQGIELTKEQVTYEIKKFCIVRKKSKNQPE